MQLLGNIQKLFKSPLINRVRDLTSANTLLWGNVIAGKIILLQNPNEMLACFLLYPADEYLDEYGLMV